MSNKKVLVTGATGAIGQVLCEHLASKGNRLILSARTQGKLEELKSVLESGGGVDHSTFVCDFSSVVSVHQALHRLPDVCDGLTGVVIMPPQAVRTAECLPDADTWSSLFSTSFVQPLELLRGLIPYLSQREGKVVLISGISSAQVLSHYATSNVLRLAWLGQMKTLAFAYGKEGIRFNTVSLGGTLTEDYKKGIAARGNAQGRSYAEQLALETDNVPLGKYASLEEVSAVVESLLGDFANHVTGMNILCDGGFTRAY